MKPNPKHSKSNQGKVQTPRINAIDQFRGFAILLMVLANYFSGINSIPMWLKHAPGIGFTVIDLVAPLFILAIGLTFGLSFQRRISRDGTWRTYNHFVSRNLALVGLGLLITVGGSFASIYDSTEYWGLLQAIGSAGLIGLIFININPKFRLVIGLIILAGYQYMLEHYWMDTVINAAHNGPQGVLSWGAMLIMATSLGDIYRDKESRRMFPLLLIIMMVSGIMLGTLVPISKHQASASYVLLSLGLSGLIFYLFHQLDALYQFRIPILSEWGKNSLLLYILHGFLLALLVIPQYPSWYISAPLWLVVVQASLLIAILSWIGIYFNNKGLILTI